MVLYIARRAFHDRPHTGRRLKQFLKFATPICAGILVPILLKFLPDSKVTPPIILPTAVQGLAPQPRVKKATTAVKPFVVAPLVVNVDIPSILSAHDFRSRILTANQMVKTPLSYGDGLYFSNEYRAAIWVLPPGCLASEEQTIIEKANHDYEQQQYEAAALEYKQVFTGINFKSTSK